MIITLYIGLMRRLPHWRIEKVTRKADIASLATTARSAACIFWGIGPRAISWVLGRQSRPTLPRSLS